MSDQTRLIRSASSAVDLLDALLEACVTRARRDSVPSLLEMLTVLRETASSLPELNCYARAREKRPAILLCGGDVVLAREVAAQLGYKLKLPDISPAAIVFSADAAEAPGIVIRYGQTVKQVSARVLSGLLESHPTTEDIILVEEQVHSEAARRFLWIPHPAAMEPFLESKSFLEILFGHDAAIVIVEETPDPLLKLFQDFGQRLWVATKDQAADPEKRSHLVSELNRLADEPQEESDKRAAAMWSWLSARLIQSIESQKRDFSLQSERLDQRLRSTRQLLEQYKTNWINGIHNLLESYLANRTNSPAFAPLIDPQKPGPVSGTFLSAMGIAALKAKIEEYITDRMAEFVAGLSAFAVKLELRQIALNEINTQWKIDNLGSRLEKLFEEKRVFTEGGGKRGGIVGALMGKAHAITGERKALISRAGRLTAQHIESDFHEWCKLLMANVERQVKLQLAGVLANKGLPDADGLRTASSGLERVGGLIRGELEESERGPETVAVEWLSVLARRRWIPLYHPARAASGN